MGSYPNYRLTKAFYFVTVISYSCFFVKSVSELVEARYVMPHS
jgi:hypothetical protein